MLLHIMPALAVVDVARSLATIGPARVLVAHPTIEPGRVAVELDVLPDDHAEWQPFIRAFALLHNAYAVIVMQPVAFDDDGPRGVAVYCEHEQEQRATIEAVMLRGVPAPREQSPTTKLRLLPGPCRRVAQ